MLGQLLHSITPRRVQPRGPTYIESVTEDNHTRNLLFPDSTALHHPDGQPIPLTSDSFGLQSPGFGFDGIHGEIDLEHSRDVRIIIGQDDVLGSPRTILYDSRQGASRPASATKTYNGRSNRYAPPNTAVPVTSGHGRRSSLVAESSAPSGHARRASLVVESSGPRSPAIGAIQRAKTRASSISAMSQIDQMSPRNRLGEADTSIHTTCLDCMFGNLTLGYKGTSNKLHIVPLEPRAVDQNINTFATVDGQGSLPKSEARKRSNLAKSYTPANPPPDMSSPSPPLPSDNGTKDRRRTVLISRTFSVTLPEDAGPLDMSGVNTPTPQSSAVKGNAFPFPGLGGLDGTSPGNGPRRSGPTKLPMYGITIVMQLPVAPQRPPSRGGLRDVPLAGSYPSHKSFGSSFDSDKRGGWSFIDSSFGVDSLLSASQSSDVDDRVDTLGQHWDVIIRTLTSLQFAIQDRLLAQLKSRDLRSTPIPQPPPAAARRSKEPVAQRISAKLLPYALMSDVEVQKAVDVAAERLVRGMKIPRVMTGQNRWGVWREEARWLGRWSGGKEENLFFFNILSAFLGHHTEWLNTLGPRKHRRLHRKQQRINAGDDLTINNRTVIITPDKMAARRLIFLLSAFLPASVQAMNGSSSPLRPGTSASGRAFSQSPPSHIAPSRQQSLRRTINRRGRPSQHHMRLATNGKSFTQQSSESSENAIESPAFDSDDFKMHTRRDSETRSTHTTLAIPAMLDAPSTTSKSSATTTSTVTPSAPMPVAHFAMQRTPSFAAAADVRPTTGDSAASANLISTLRGGSGHVSNLSNDSQSSGRWSGFMSFWSSGRRDSSTSPSDILQTTDEGLGISGSGYRKSAAVSSPNKLEQMVREVRELELRPPPQQYSPDMAEGAEDLANDSQPSSSGVPCSGARDIPARSKSESTPLKLSVNERDGVIDVDIPLPGFGSPMMSPTMPEFHHHTCNADTASFGYSSTRSFSQGEHDQPVNVAGWLGKFHADFELQGVNPYAGVEDDIRKAMLAEPTPISAATTPSLESGPTDRWVDVCSALIADTNAFTVKKIRLRRLVRLVPIPSQPAITPGRTVGLPTRSAYFDPYQVPGGQLAPSIPVTEMHLDWKFTEEIIMDIDETLTDAVERILAQSGQPSRVQSEASSRSSSRRGRLDGRADSDFPGPPMLEIPRAECKQLVLGALEQVVKDVQAERMGAAATHGTRRSRSADSTLREGIRRWLTEVE